MQKFTIPSGDRKTALACYRTECEKPRAMMQISHGMCEYFLRYTGFAEYLSGLGFLVFGHDHLGHGHTAPDAASLGFTVSGGGADCLVEDVYSLSLHMKREYPGLPLILFGHSMGSFIARETLARHGGAYRAAVICGTGGPEMPAGAGRALARLIMLFRGEHYRSRLLKNIAFAGYNKKYDAPATDVDWLTRDPEVVRRYLDDPLCNFTFTVRAYDDLFTLVGWVSRRDWASRLPKGLPVLVTSGDMDPVGGWGKGVRSVADRLREAGLEVTLRLWPGMRHEILNETEHEQVWKEIGQWMQEWTR